MYNVSECKNPKYFISWGKGVQSTYLCMLAVEDKITVDAIVTAETGWEHPHTYEVEKYYNRIFEDKGIPVLKAFYADIHNDLEGKFGTTLPVFSSPTGGMLNRRCTGEYKIEPLRMCIRKFMGLRLDNKGRTLRNTAIMYLGISYDEFTRMKDSNRAWIKNEYPLVDRRISREDCINYFMDNNLLVPGKSSCVICPYKSNKSWQVTKTLYPEEFRLACEFDKKLRQSNKDRNGGRDLYLHKKLQPLEEVVFDNSEKQEDYSCESGYCFI